MLFETESLVAEACGGQAAEQPAPRRRAGAR